MRTVDLTTLEAADTPGQVAGLRAKARQLDPLTPAAPRLPAGHTRRPRRRDTARTKPLAESRPMRLYAHRHHPVQSAWRPGPAGCARYAPGQDAPERVLRWSGPCRATASGAVSAGSNPAGGLLLFRPYPQLNTAVGAASAIPGATAQPPDRHRRHLADVSHSAIGAPALHRN